MYATDTPILVVRGLEGNQPTHLIGLQIYLAPHILLLERIWWAALILSCAYMAWRHVLYPLITTRR
jgi:hypothetical protein